MKKCIILVIIGFLLVVGTAGAAFAQPPAFPVLNEYFVNLQGQVVGPHGADGLRQLIIQGQMTRDSFVWTEGMPAWAAAGTVVELAPLFAGAPPPLPPTPHAWEQSAPQAMYGGPWGGHPVVAGLVNTIFGVWSFTNDDFAGGFRTAGLQIGGALISIYVPMLFLPRGVSTIGDWERYLARRQMVIMVGTVVSVGGTVYGFLRGFTQYNRKTAAARSFAEAINTNPMNNISMVAVPTLFDDRRFVGTLTYSLSF